jgi:ABC-2 type transport system permease protein
MVLGAQVLVSLVIAILAGLLLVLVASVVYGAESPRSTAGLMPAFLLSALCFASIGVLLGALLPTARAAQGAGLLLFFVMMMICGAGPPPEVMSEPMRRIGGALPLTYVIRLLQDPWLGFGWSATALLVVAGFMVGAAAVSLRAFRWE